MSKRCCAASCYNSVATNRSVEYFGFPKSNEYAAAWAKAAGREDLLEKSLCNIIKYYLCSEHFSDDCFQDPPHNRKLRKTSRPVVVPIPTIFHNNFNECVSKSLKEEKTDQPTEILVLNTLELPQEPMSNDIIDRRRAMNEADEVQAMEPIILEAIDDNLVPTDIEVVHYDGLKVEEDHTLTDMDEEQIQFQPEDDTFERISSYTEIDIGPTSCRLCLAIKKNELFVPIFEYGSEAAYILEALLPGAVKPDDGLPQQICLACLESATRCLSTIEKFKAVQDKLKELQ